MIHSAHSDEQLSGIDRFRIRQRRLRLTALAIALTVLLLVWWFHIHGWL